MAQEYSQLWHFLLFWQSFLWISRLINFYYFLIVIFQKPDLKFQNFIDMEMMKNYIKDEYLKEVVKISEQDSP